jgi:RNA polymerase sporulation-specific sigma factor
MNTELMHIIETNKNIIYKIASKYRDYYNVEDLYQVGVIGLIEAYKNYNKNSNAKFISYAYMYIIGNMVEYIKKDKSIKVSDNLTKLYKAYEKSKDYLTQKLQRAPTIEELSVFMKADEKIIYDVILSKEKVSSLDEKIYNNDYDNYEFIGKDTTNEIDNKIILENSISKLDDVYKKIIQYRYYDDYTQSETAKFMNMSQVQVSRHESKALKLIKKEITM